MQNLKSIELTKGLAIICILFVNMINFWLDYNYDSIFFYFRLLIVILELFGSSLFVFIFSFSTIFTLKKKMGSIPNKKNRNKVFKQGFLLILLGLIYNLILSYIDNSTLMLWGWNIITFIGCGQIISYFAFKLVRWARLSIGLIIIIITPYLVELMFYGKASIPTLDVLYYIFVSPNPVYPFLPFASLWFFSSVFSELIYEAILLEVDIANVNAARSILKYGFIFIILSFLYSAIQLFPFIEPFSINLSKYPFIFILPILRGTPYNYIPGLPEVLIKGTLQNILFISGVSLSIFGLIYYEIDIKRKINPISTILVTFGNISITLMFLQLIFLPLFNQSLIYYVFLIISPIYLVLTGFIGHLWKKHGDLKYSLEWLIQIGNKKIYNEII